jgi:hypothetical protein
MQYKRVQEIDLFSHFPLQINGAPFLVRLRGPTNLLQKAAPT